jgi:hypothetical protein
MAQITSISTEAKTALRQAKHKIKQVDGTVSATSKHFSASLAEAVAKQATRNYEEFEEEVKPYDRQQRAGWKITAEPSGEGYKVIARGPHVVFDEFGTGDRGLYERKHPNKPASYYNQGKYIRTNKNGGHYWIYKSPVTGTYVRTIGIPAGMYMYNAFSAVSDVIMGNILQKELTKSVKATVKGDKYVPDDFTNEILQQIDS